jgi:hypothetical protein
LFKRFDQIKQGLPRHNLLHLGLKLLLLGALVGGGLLVTGHAKLIVSFTTLLAFIYAPILPQMA